MSLCESNPCKNDALCLEEDDTSVCYCVPDYHGDRCQYQYDECQLGPGYIIRLLCTMYTKVFVDLN